MRGAGFFAAALFLAFAALCLWLFRREQKRRLADSARWGSQEQALRRQQNALEQDFQQLTSALRSLHPLISSYKTEPPYASWAEAVLASAAATAEAGQAMLLRFDPQRLELRPVATRGVAPAAVESFCIEPGAGALGRAAQRRDGSVVDTAPDGAGLEPPLWVWPFVIQEEPAALLILAKAGALSPSVHERLSFLVQQATLSLAVFGLSESLSASYAELAQALWRALESRESCASAPAHRTRALVQAMADEYRLPGALARHVQYGALLRDLGKMAMDDTILRKPEKLTPEEYDRMKEHPAIGHRILQPVPFLRPAAAIVLYHQEWFNGQGYPEGLAGEEIPLGARLVSVVDAWEAMISERPYRAALSTAAAIAELRRHAGTQFDPKMVDVFLRAIDRLERAGAATEVAHVS